MNSANSFSGRPVDPARVISQCSFFFCLFARLVGNSIDLIPTCIDYIKHEQDEDQCSYSSSKSPYFNVTVLS